MPTPNLNPLRTSAQHWHNMGNIKDENDKWEGSILNIGKKEEHQSHMEADHEKGY